MDAPKCRLCGKRHWGNCVSHIDGMANGVANKTTTDESRRDEIPKESRRPAGGVVGGTRPLLLGEGISDGVLTSKAGQEGLCSRVRSSPTYKYRDAEKRKTYQRDLMRKRRAK